MSVPTIERKKINLQETTSLLGVSSATVRNWVRHSYLTPEGKNGKEMTFDRSQIKSLKEKLASGEIGRLNSRANKKHSINTFIPEEYADNVAVIDLAQKIIAIDGGNKFDPKSVLFGVALMLLKNEGLINYKKPFSFSHLTYKNEMVKNELSWWFNATKNKFSADKHIFDFDVPKGNDLLGLLYQSLTAEGDKACSGSYYTPRKVVNEIVDEYVKSASVVLDPCCGTGQFLLSAAEKISEPGSLWGFDIDEIAVRIARLNLLLKFPDKNFTPHVYVKNTLLEFFSNDLFAKQEYPRFDVVITNPPWGAHFSQKELAQLQSLYPSIKSGESFSYFLNKGIEFLKEGGILSFILPEAILNVKSHRDIREILLSSVTIKKIKHLDRVFKNVFTPVVRIDILKGPSKQEVEFQAERDDDLYTVKQSRLSKNPDYSFDVFTGGQDLALLKKFYDLQHKTLENNAEWALGVVTGNNQKYLLDKPIKNSEPILTGKEIKKFIHHQAKNYVVFEPDRFQQVAPEDKYRADEKLVYKFISKDLVFSYDDGKTLTLNSANILIPKLKDYPVKSILALLNSVPYQFIHQKKSGSIKILKGDLEKLPMPILSEKQHGKIGEFLEVLLDQNYNDEERIATYSELNNYIMDIFELSGVEKSYVLDSVKISYKLFAA